MLSGLDFVIELVEWPTCRWFIYSRNQAERRRWIRWQTERIQLIRFGLGAVREPDIHFRGSESQFSETESRIDSNWIVEIESNSIESNQIQSNSIESDRFELNLNRIELNSNRLKVRYDCHWNVNRFDPWVAFNREFCRVSFLLCLTSCSV